MAPLAEATEQESLKKVPLLGSRTIELVRSWFGPGSDLVPSWYRSGFWGTRMIIHNN